MNKREISRLIHFNFWANDRILAACECISADEFTRKHIPNLNWGSLRGILVHTLDTQYGWRFVLQAQGASDVLQADDFADVAGLKVSRDKELAAWFGYVSSLSEDSLDLEYDDDPRNEVNVWQTIVHVVTYGIQHRSKAAAILTGYDHSPSELDFDLFLNEKPDLSSYQVVSG